MHDCTAVPFPVGPVDLAYCRMLLAHLPDPGAVLGRWLDHAAVVAVDEVHAMEVDHPVLVRYEEVVTTLVASRGARMDVGPLLDEAPGERRTRCASSRADPALPVGASRRRRSRRHRLAPEAPLRGRSPLSGRARTAG